MIKEIIYKDNEFYNTMGKYFADRSFIKELDNQLYDNEKMIWFLYYEEELKGFASLEIDKKIKLDNVYVLPKYRHNGICNELIKHITTNTSKEIELITRNEIAKRIYEKYGFKEKSKNGRFYKMVREEINK